MCIRDRYNALRDGKVTEYHLESIKEPNGPEMRALRGPDMSMVFQDPMSSLNPVYKVGDQVAEGLLQHNKGMKKDEARKLVLEMFKKLGIPDPEERIDCYPHQFSGGMKPVSYTHLFVFIAVSTLHVEQEVFVE